MKKFKLLPLIGLTTLGGMVMPLVSCNKEDSKAPTFNVANSQMINDKIAYIQLDWEPSEDSVIVSNFTFQYNDGTNPVTVEPESESGARPFKLKLTFTNSQVNEITDGVLNFHYSDQTTKAEGGATVNNIGIAAPEIFSLLDSSIISPTTGSIDLTWILSDVPLTITNPTFTYGDDKEADVDISIAKLGQQKLNLFFDSDMSSGIEDGQLSFHYENTDLQISGDKTINDIQMHLYENPLCFTGAAGEGNQSTVSYVINGTVGTLEMKYRYEGDGEWTNWSPNSPLTIDNGQKIYVKNTTDKLSTSSTNYVNFKFTNNVAASGNINSLINYADLTQFCFWELFLGTQSEPTPLISAPELPAVKLAKSCYENMFTHCESIVTTPELPATHGALDSYGCMFQHCYSLTKISSEFPKMEGINRTYSGMFLYCMFLKISDRAGNKFFVFLSQNEGDAANMFTHTGGEFKGSPVIGNTYYWYE